ncbi:MAG: hypothetical protein Q8P05_05840 [Candidatus Diapherotrites archaeon]|nr:hypothetical protein [Candidatus Diapherotrites archaeon]MDZ4256597.1 hypothetical protein [archaeon]
MVNPRGQFWTLDVVLAAVVFTLALGLVLGQAEKQVYLAQEEKEYAELVRVTNLAAAALTSHPEIVVSLCFDGQSRKFKFTNCTLSTDEQWAENIRCGPNTTRSISNLGVVGPLKSSAWATDYELSPMLNCFVDRPAGARLSVLDLFNDYLFRLDTPGYKHKMLFAPRPPGQPFFSIERKMLLFDAHPDPIGLRKCMDGLCGVDLNRVRITVWKR